MNQPDKVLYTAKAHSEERARDQYRPFRRRLRPIRI